MRLFKLRILALFLLLLMCVSFTYFTYSEPILLKYSNEVEVYSVKNGSDCVIKKAKKGDFIPRKTGESCTVNASAQKILDELDVTVYKIEILGGIVNYYGYSDELKYGVELFGKRINVQVCDDGRTVKLGTPLIYGSY